MSEVLTPIERRIYNYLVDYLKREDQLEAQVRGIAEDMGVGAGKLIHPLRVALTGSAVSPGIFEVMTVMGRGLVLERIDLAMNKLRVMAERERS